MDRVIRALDGQRAVRDQDLIVRLDALRGRGGRTGEAQGDVVAAQGGARLLEQDRVDAAVHGPAAGSGGIRLGGGRSGIEGEVRDVLIAGRRRQGQGRVSGTAAVDFHGVGRFGPDAGRLVVVVVVSRKQAVALIQRLAHDQVERRPGAQRFAGVRGIGVGVDVQDRVALGDHDVIRRVDAVAGRVDLHDPAGDRHGPPLIALGRNVAVLGLDAVAAARDQQQAAGFHGHGVVALQGVVGGAHLQCELLHLQVLGGVHAVVVAAGHDQAAGAGQGQVALRVNGAAGRFLFGFRLVVRAQRAGVGHFVVAFRGDRDFVRVQDLDRRVRGAADRRVAQDDLYFLIRRVDHDLAVAQGAAEGILTLCGNGVDRALLRDAAVHGGQDGEITRCRGPLRSGIRRVRRFRGRGRRARLGDAGRGGLIRSRRGLIRSRTALLRGCSGTGSAASARREY